MSDKNNGFILEEELTMQASHSHICSNLIEIFLFRYFLFRKNKRCVTRHFSHGHVDNTLYI